MPVGNGLRLLEQCMGLRIVLVLRPPQAQLVKHLGQNQGLRILLHQHLPGALVLRGSLRIVTLSVVQPGPGQQNRHQTPAAVTCPLQQRHCLVQGLLRWLQAALLLLAVRQGQQGLHAGRHIGLGRSIDRQGRQLLQIGLRLVMFVQTREQITQGLQRFFAQRQRDGICRQGLCHFESPPIALHCLARLLHGLLHIAQIPGHGCGIGMRAQADLIQLQRLEQRLLGFGLVAAGLLDQSEQIQTAGHIGPLPLALLLCQLQCLTRGLLGGFIRLLVLLAQGLVVQALPLRSLSKQWRACRHADQQRQRHQRHLHGPGRQPGRPRHESRNAFAHSHAPLQTQLARLLPHAPWPQGPAARHRAGR